MPTPQKIKLGALFIAAGLCGCGEAASPGDPGAVSTGLEGRVWIGPTQPVCREGEACERPIAATFHVQQDDHDVATFISGEDGRFSVPLKPGDYVVVPDAAAPVMGGAAQSQPVTVGPTGMTQAELTFDTGIR